MPGSASPGAQASPVDIRLTDDPLDVSAAVAAMTCAEAGGIDVFVGITRAEEHPEQGELVALEYHAYPEMALTEIRKIGTRAIEQWPVKRIAIWHRRGAVSIGAASVVIAVSCAHRGDAFAACQFAIDELKKSVPIWKKEIFTQETRWQGEPAQG